MKFSKEEGLDGYNLNLKSVDIISNILAFSGIPLILVNNYFVNSRFTSVILGKISLSGFFLCLILTLICNLLALKGCEKIIAEKPSNKIGALKLFSIGKTLNYIKIGLLFISLTLLNISLIL